MASAAKSRKDRHPSKAAPLNLARGIERSAPASRLGD